MINNNKGITLISLVVTIVVMLILAISLTASVTSTIELQEYNKVKEDIINLSEEVKVYYLKNKKLPVYTNREYRLSSYDVPTYDINPNDSGVYYAIDLTVLPEDLKLNCGEGNVYKDFSSDDLYVLDKESLTVYYLKGAVLNGEKHYTIVDDYNGGGFATDYYSKIEMSEQFDSNYVVDGKTGKDTLVEAVAEATNGSVIKVMKDTTETQQITIDKDITLNTNGKTITISNDSTGILIDATCVFYGHGKIYANNNSNYPMAGLIRSNGSLTIDGVEMENGDSYALAPYFGSVIINSGNIKKIRAWNGSLTVNGGSIEQIDVRCGTIDLNGGKIGTVDCAGLSGDEMTINIGDESKEICEIPVIQKLLDSTDIVLSGEAVINFNNGIIGHMSSGGNGNAEDIATFMEYVRSGYSLKVQSDGYYHLVIYCFGRKLLNEKWFETK